MRKTFPGEKFFWKRQLEVSVESDSPVSLPLLAEWSGRSRYCPNPEGEFAGWSETSPEQQKEGDRSESRASYCRI